jgi:hypothetical protein
MKRQRVPKWTVGNNPQNILICPWIFYIIFIITVIPKWVPCHRGMARPQVADGGDALQLWVVAANILNKQLLKADKRWSSCLWAGCGANSFSPYKKACYENVQEALDVDRFPG